MILLPSFPVPAIVLVAAALAAFAIVALVRGRGPRWAWALRLVAIVLLAVVALRPAIPGSASGPTASGGLEVYFALDTTSSMAAEDYAGARPRLEGAKADVVAIADALAGAQFSLVTFDAGAVQRVPLTADVTALESAASVLTQEVSDYSRGSSIDAALPMLESLLEESRSERPDNRRVLFYLGDGEQTAATPPESFASLAPMLDGGGVLGYGTSEGGRMLRFDGFGDEYSELEYIADPATGTDAVSRIDEATLGEVAAQLGVAYAHREGPSSVDAIVTGIEVGELTVQQREPIGPTELYWIPAIPLGGILLLELGRIVLALLELRRVREPR
jgi:Ca-activated chloride channel family protein